MHAVPCLLHEVQRGPQLQEVREWRQSGHLVMWQMQRLALHARWCGCPWVGIEGVPGEAAYAAVMGEQ